MVLGLLWRNVAYALPKCKGEDFSKWTNCVGAYTDDEGHKYTGEFGNVPGKRHGKGIAINKNGDVYKGQFKNNKAHGYGTFTIKIFGYKYTGKFKDGKQHGHGRETSYIELNPSDTVIYIGEFKNGEKQGKGTFEGKIKEPKSRIYYTGEWKNNLWHGQGKLIYTSAIERVRYEGEFKEGQQHGQGTVYKNGKLFGKGIWENDRLIDSTKNLI